MKQKILALDTSSKVLALAFADGDRVLWEKNYSRQMRHQERLFCFIEEGLKKLKWKIDDIGILVCGLGPGSFTGLRVGLAAMKGLAVSGKKKSVGISSLDLIAHNAPLKNEVCVILDARRGKIYGAHYSVHKGFLKKKGKDRMVDVSGVKQYLRQNKKPVYLMGDAVAVYGAELKESFGKKVILAPEKKWYPCGKNIIICAQEYIQKKVFLKVRDIKPNYIQKSLAEQIKKKRKVIP